MEKAIIGVMPLWDDEKESLWMLPNYLEGVKRAGGIPIIFPFTNEREDLEKLASTCDGFIFTGGHDISPRIYGEEPIAELGPRSDARDEMELIVLDIALRDDKAVLGICRGLQLINAAFGGTLYQDLAVQFEPSLDRDKIVNHHQERPYDAPIHEIIISKDAPILDCFTNAVSSNDPDDAAGSGVTGCGVNSLHHQGIKELAPGLVAMVKAPDGLVEAFYKPDAKFVWAVQWHPEFFLYSDPSGLNIFKRFVDAAKDS